MLNGTHVQMQSTSKGLHSSMCHEVLRAWQDPHVGELSAVNIVYPLFIGMDSEEKTYLSELPGQYR